MRELFGVTHNQQDTLSTRYRYLERRELWRGLATVRCVLSDHIMDPLDVAEGMRRYEVLQAEVRHRRLHPSARAHAPHFRHTSHRAPLHCTHPFAPQLVPACRALSYVQQHRIFHVEAPHPSPHSATLKASCSTAAVLHRKRQARKTNATSPGRPLHSLNTPQ